MKKLVLVSFLGLLFLGFFLSRRVWGAVIDFGIFESPFVEAWFQTQGGDVHADGSISSDLPSGEVFSEDLDGYPGVISFGTSFSYGEGGISSTNWKAKSIYGGRKYGYNYFERLIENPQSLSSDPSESELEALVDGSYKVDGDLTLPDTPWNINNKKIVILVDGDLIIRKRINIGQEDFVAFIVKGNITVEGDVVAAGANPALEGVYIADGTITIENGTQGGANQRFEGKGVFVAWSGFALQRDLGGANSNTPAELFIYNPRVLVNAPQQLKRSSYRWKEVVP